MEGEREKGKKDQKWQLPGTRLLPCSLLHSLKRETEKEEMDKRKRDEEEGKKECMRNEKEDGEKTRPKKRGKNRLRQ